MGVNGPAAGHWSTGHPLTEIGTSAYGHCSAHLEERGPNYFEGVTTIISTIVETPPTSTSPVGSNFPPAAPGHITDAPVLAARALEFSRLLKKLRSTSC